MEYHVKLCITWWNERWNTILYFQKQNISFRMQVIERDYKDVIILEPLNVNAKKIHRVRDYFKEVPVLHEWWSNGSFQIKTKLKEVEGRSGYKEWEDFWRKLYRTNASLVKQDMEKCFNHLQKLCDACDKLQPNSSIMEKGAMRRSQKNQKKRKIWTTEEMTSSAKKTSYQETVDKFFCKKEENVVIDLNMNVQCHE